MTTRTFGYQLTRQKRGRFEGRQDYIGTLAGRTQHPELCIVMEKLVGGFERKAQAEALNAARKVKGGSLTERDIHRAHWAGFPWLTLVMGSGCLEISDQLGLEPSRVGTAVASVLEGLLADEEPDLAGVGLLAKEAASFAAGLVVDRRHVVDPGTPPPTRSEPAVVVDTLAARTVLAAALASRFFYYVMAGSCTPLSRWNEEVAAVSGTAGAIGLSAVIDELRDETVAQLEILQVDAASDEMLGEKVQEWTTALFSDIQNGLQAKDPHLARTDLHLLTELAWYLLTRNTSIYPGWTDLLLGLTLRERHDSAARRRRARPRFYYLQEIPKLVRQLYERPTNASWDELVGEDLPVSRPAADREPSTRSRLYHAAAGVLWRQAAVIDREPNSECPPPSVFVTSFDIEMEMALWLHAVRASHDGETPTFYVVVPVHVLRNKSDQRAALCWLRGEIRPDPALTGKEALTAIRRPRNWRVLTPSHDDRDLIRGPNIVHFSGGPLFTLPSRDPDEPASDARALDALASEVLDAGVALKKEELATMVVQHAVTVDEYLAFRQSEVELIWSREGELGRGLHPFLLGSSTEPGAGGRNPRFWMALGVPMSDTAIRHRIVTQITLHDLNMIAFAESNEGRRPRERLGNRPAALTGGGGGATATPPEHPPTAPNGNAGDEPGLATQRESGILDGVVVNRHINDDEASLLYWVGFDVVGDDAVNFIGDLEHYSEHLSIDPLPRPDRTAGCPIKVHEA